MPGKEDSLGKVGLQKTNFSWNNRWNKREEYRYTQA